ncbi:hypothetical protein BWI17_18345 [Betaproteobacteria bacterium GR16-43]|nr:hypothetical protein BWI17_18345 [Betaproteobacteria bacterium GR16-43]
MSPKTELAFHSILAVILCVAAIGTVIAAGYWTAELQGLRGKALDRWMIGASLVGLVPGLIVFFGYQWWILPDRLRGGVDPQAAERLAQEAENRKAIARAQAQQEALRQELRATPGLERYAEIIGRSTIGSVEDARMREVRVAALRADRVKAKYADRVFKGEDITDRMIAYWENPAARVLCSHLAALEADVRKADPGASPSADNALEANLGFDFDMVKRRYALGDTITFWRRKFGPEYYGRGEDYFDGAERIECTEHRCVLNGSGLRPKF